MVKRILIAGLALLLFLAGCTKPKREPEPLPQSNWELGIYELHFSVTKLSGEEDDSWKFTYRYEDEPITSGHRIAYPLELFSFHGIEVEVTKTSWPFCQYSTHFPVAICHGGSGKTEITVPGSNGNSTTFQITCEVVRVES